MKKKLLIGTLGAALVFGGAFAVGATGNNGANTINKTNTEKTMLSTDEIKNIALQEIAGVVEEIELEKKSGKFVYEVDIEQDDVDYDLHIDAYSGEIYVIDSDDDHINSSNSSQNHKNIISQNDAISIAEKSVNGKVLEIEKDNDDGLIKYEVELKTDRGEVDVEINAVSGQVLDIEWND